MKLSKKEVKSLLKERQDELKKNLKELDLSKIPKMQRQSAQEKLKIRIQEVRHAKKLIDEYKK